MEKRRSKENYYLDIADAALQRSTCLRRKYGAIVVKEDEIVSTGYNGSIVGNPHCHDVGHTMRDGHCIATIHAEMNALLYCAKEGISVKGCTAYVTHFPCLNCTKSLIQAGITRIYYHEGYRIDEYALQLLNRNGIEAIQIGARRGQTGNDGADRKTIPLHLPA